jgi:hypothetical protein
MKTDEIQRIYHASSQVALTVLILNILNKKKPHLFNMAKFYVSFNMNKTLDKYYPLETCSDKMVRRYYKKIMGIPETIFDCDLDLSDLTKSQVSELSKWAKSYRE